MAWACFRSFARPSTAAALAIDDGKTSEQIAGFAARTPHKRLGEPSDVAAAVAALCGSDGAWINGRIVFANGGIV